MLRRVTFSGIDPWTKPSALQTLHAQYPFVEFAYLMTDNRKAGNRYPAPVFLKGYAKLGLPMAVHLCGKIAHDYIKSGDWEPVRRMLGASMSLFSRIQLNIPKTVHFSRELVFPEDKAIIIQLHPGTEELFACYKHHPSVQGFQDGSGGRGIACSHWMAPETPFFGYAGGIGPENVVETVRAISAVCDGDFWIDMETGIRTADRFDVGKCRKVCEALVKSGLIQV